MSRMVFFSTQAMLILGPVGLLRSNEGKWGQVSGRTELISPVSLSLERPLNDLQVGRAALLQHEAVSRLLGPRVQEALGCQGF